MPPKKKKKQKNIADMVKKQKEKDKKDVDKKTKQSVVDMVIAPPLPKSSNIKKHPPSHNKILQEKADQQEVRKLFNIISTSSPSESLDIITVYINDKGLSHKTRKFFNLFKNTLPGKYYIDFSIKFQEQDIMNLSDFWVEYTKQDKVMTDIVKKIQSEDDKLLIDEKLIDLFGESTDEDEDEEDIKEKTTFFPHIFETKPSGKKIKFIDSEDKIIEHIKPKKKYYEPLVDESCLRDFKQYPWLKSSIGSSIKKVFIRSLLRTDINLYITSNINIEYNNEIYYKVNKKFINLLCSSLFKQSQKGNILILETIKGVDNMVLNFEVLFETENSKLFIQDELIMEKQKKYFREKRKNKDEKINSYKTQPVTEQAKQIGIAYLSRSLHYVAPNVIDYGIFKDYKIYNDTDFILQVINKISKNCPTIDCFFNKISEIVAFLKIDNVGEGIFIKRLKKQLYLPDVLVDLTIKEKLPEFYINGKSIDPDLTSKIQKIIDVKKSSIVLSLLTELYNYHNPGNRKQTKVDMFTFNSKEDNFTTTNWKELCKNKKDIEGVDSEELIHYMDDNDGFIYCFNIRDITDEILTTGKYINPYTSKDLSKPFIDQIIKTFNIKPEIVSHASENIKPISLEKPLTPGLLKLIIRNIEECDREQVEDKLNEEGKCESLDRGPSVSSEEEEEEEEEEDEEEIVEGPVIEEVIIENTELKHSDKDLEIKDLKEKYGNIISDKDRFKVLCQIFKDNIPDGSTCLDNDNTQNLEVLKTMDIEVVKEKLNKFDIQYKPKDNIYKLMKKFIIFLNEYQSTKTGGFAPEVSNTSKCGNPKCRKIVNKSSENTNHTFYTKNGDHYEVTMCSLSCFEKTKWGKLGTGGGRMSAADNNN